MSPIRHRPTRRAASALAAGWMIALTGTVLATASMAYADDTATSGFAVTVPTASPTPTTTPPATTPPTAAPPTTTTPARQSASGTGNRAATNDGSAADTPAPIEPAISPAPSDGDPAALDAEVYQPGSGVTVTASGFDPGEQVQAVLYSEPILLGNFSADANGDISVTFTLPEDLLAGPHTAQLTGWASGHIAVAKFLMGSAPLDSSGAAGSVPPWAWWVGGAASLAGLGYGGRRLWQVMRAPGPATAQVSAA